MRTLLAKRLAEIETEVAKIAPPVETPEWAHWATDSEIDWLEQLYRGLAVNGGEPTAADQLRIWSIYAAACARMIEAKGDGNAGHEV